MKNSFDFYIITEKVATFPSVVFLFAELPKIYNFVCNDEYSTNKLGEKIP